MRLTLDQLESLEAIAQTGSFAAAAQHLHKVQSAVSYAVRTLEETLGVKVFDRSGHRARLTPAGRAILEESRQLLARARRVEALAGRFKGGFEPALTVVVDGVLPMRPVLQALQQLAREGVPTHVQVRVEYLTGVTEAFSRGQADLMLAKELAVDPALVITPLPEQEMVLVAAREHPLAKARRAVTVEDLQAHVELTVHDTAEAKRQQDTHLFGGARVFYLAGFESKLEALRMALGFGWMPRAMVEAELSRGSLKVLKATLPTVTAFSPVLARPAGVPLGRTGARLVELLARPQAWRAR